MALMIPYLPVERHDYRSRGPCPRLVPSVKPLTSALANPGITCDVGTLGTVVLEVLAGLIVVTAWYVAFVRYNRSRANEIVRWVRTALSGQAQVLGLHWSSSSRFHIKLRMCPGVFQRSSVVVQLIPREFLVNWILSRFRRQQEVATFEADLDTAPAFNLEVHHQRWCGRSRRGSRLDPHRGHIEAFGPFVLTTRQDWQGEITAMVDALVASRDCDFLSVTFRRTSPHLSATVALDSLAPQHVRHENVINVLRELADCASAARF